jgi:hypothetical protein
MKDIRCILGWHKLLKKQVEDSQYFECARCGKPLDSGGVGGVGHRV